MVSPEGLVAEEWERERPPHCGVEGEGGGRGGGGGEYGRPFDQNMGFWIFQNSVFFFFENLKNMCFSVFC